MLKEAALFTVSTGALIFFLFPAPAEKEAIPQEINQIEKTERVERPRGSKKVIEDSWDYDDEGGLDEDFVFGQPMMTDDSDDYADNDDDEDFGTVAGDERSTNAQANAAENKQSDGSNSEKSKNSRSIGRSSLESPVAI